MVPMEFQQGSQASSCVEAWNSAFLSSCKMGVRPPVDFRWGTWAFTKGATGESNLPSCCDGIVSVPYMSLQGNQASSRVEGELGVFSGFFFFFLSSDGKIPYELRRGSQGTTRVASGKLVLLLRCESHLGMPLQ